MSGTVYLKGSSCSSDQANHIMQVCRWSLVLVFHEKSETWVIFPPRNLRIFKFWLLIKTKINLNVPN